MRVGSSFIMVPTMHSRLEGTLAMAHERSGSVLSGQLGMLYSLGTVGEWSDGQLLGRFLAREDPAESEAAFAVLVERHGAMVLRVCQRILGDSHDAHDAFQATFLLLVRKANTIRSRESVGDWLFRIARRVAVRPRVDSARRRHRLEALVAERRRSLGGKAAIPHEAESDYGSLIAEVDRLPERFRAPVVLHYFEGLSTEATARRLGCAAARCCRGCRGHGTGFGAGSNAAACRSTPSGRSARWRIGWPGAERSRRCWSRPRSGLPPRWAWPARRSRASCRPPSPRWRTG